MRIAPKPRRTAGNIILAIVLGIVLVIGIMVAGIFLASEDAPPDVIHIPHWALLFSLMVIGAVIFICVDLVKTRKFSHGCIALLPEGILITDGYGSYLADWDNISSIGTFTLRGKYIGINVKDMERVLSSHKGTAGQKGALSRCDPFMGYELLIRPGQMKMGAEKMLKLLNTYLNDPYVRHSLAYEPGEGI